ncbi:MAG: hypothetical protein A2X46_08855 [Lentisphaerae bacterium GWF2_57_35]|nr:MAG: hypothetical protein A2X46_08855 [Lentisphaerae bacterium GWF2_57_35]
MILLTALYWPIVLDQFRFYQHPAHLSVSKASLIAGKACAVILAGQLSVLFLFHIVWVNRTYMLGAMAATLALVCLRHGLYIFMFRKKIRDGTNRGYPVLIASSAGEASQLIQWLKGHPEEYYDPVGVIVTDRQESDAARASVIEGVPVCGDVSDLVRAMHEFSVSSVVIGSSGLTLDLVRQVVAACETEGVDAWLLANLVQTKTARATTGIIADREALLFTTSMGAEWKKVIKRIFDILGALIGILLLWPLMLLVALLIRLTSPGPVLFKQQRCGLHGTPFTMWKFRSMTTDAEMRKAELELFNEMSGPVFKVSNDPRITRVGKVLRRWSLDELPQLFNVLFGGMSLVGPRPLPVYEVQKFDDLAHRRRLSMKPGLTCLWQIRGRNKVTCFDEWVRLDLEYIDKWSLGLDIKILLQTPWVVLRGSGV